MWNFKVIPRPCEGSGDIRYELFKGLLLAVNFLHVGDEIEHLVRVADFVVVPAYNLNEGGSELDTCLGVEDRGEGAAEEVA